MDGDGGVSNGSCYYSLLGIRNNASAADIRSAYRKLALKWHPDRWAKDPTAAGEAKRRFQRIQEAYFEQRKLGYMSLGRFKQALESSRKSKETLQLQLLLTYLQNGISESWQKMPSIIAIFTAEASFTLLDTAQNQFFTINKFLMHCPGVNLKSGEMGKYRG